MLRILLHVTDTQNTNNSFKILIYQVAKNENSFEMSEKGNLLGDLFFKMCNLWDWCRKRDGEFYCISHLRTSEVIAYRFRGQNRVRIVHFLVVKLQEHRC